MEISTRTIVQKMQRELHKIENTKEVTTMKESMQHIHLLSELWLDEYSEKNNSLQASGFRETVPNAAKPLSTSVAEEKLDDHKDDFSIFDF